MIPVNEPLLAGNEKKYLQECIDTGWISSEGPFVKKFEEQFATRVKRKHGIAVTNGTAALEAAVVALGIGKGDEVILPTFCIISCAGAIVKAGATPVLVDSDPLTFNMSASQVAEKITVNTKAIMVVHTYGLPVDMNPILELAKKHNLKIIEDAAEMHGQTYHGKSCGSFGDISIFSFYPNKHITTGEGGMIVTDNDELSEKCQSLRNLCFQKEKRFVHEELGWNLRMTNLQAAVGVAQLEQLDKFIQRKREIGERYTNNLQEIEDIQLPIKETEYAKNIYWVYSIVLENQKAEEITNKLNTQKIGTRPFFWPMHQQPVFHKMRLFKNESYPIAEKIGRNGFYVPSGLGITNAQIDEVSETLKKILIS